MQESGVSKRVSVRFEDISADGELSGSPEDAAAGSADEPAGARESHVADDAETDGETQAA